MPKSNTPKLNDTQLIILSAASQREDGLAVLPESLKPNVAETAVTKLLGLGFLKEVRIKRDQPTWRTDEEDKPVGLKISKAGFAVIGVADEGPGEDEPTHEPEGRRKPKKQARQEITAAREPRPGSKQAQIISLMQRKNGATLDDMVEATDWLPHTTRAALTGLRKRGYAVEKGKSPKGNTVYRISAEGGSVPADQQVG
jgi:hypothetical protein